VGVNYGIFSHLPPPFLKGGWGIFRDAFPNQIFFANLKSLQASSTDGGGRVLRMNNVEVVYSTVILVLRGVSLEVPDSGIVCLLGANGAGKSTTLKAISGCCTPNWEKSPMGISPFRSGRSTRKLPRGIAAMGITQVMEGRRLFPHLTTEENLLIGGHLTPDRSQLRKRLERVYQYFPKLKDCGPDEWLSIRRGAAECWSREGR